MDIAQRGELRLDGLAEGGVESIDRAVSLCRCDDPLPADVHLYGRLRHQLAHRLPGMDETNRRPAFLTGGDRLRLCPPFGDDPVGLDPEGLREVGSRRRPHEQLQASRRRPRSDSRRARGASRCRAREPSRGESRLRPSSAAFICSVARPASSLTTKRVPLPTEIGLDVLVGVGSAGDGARVQAGLVGEGGLADVGPLRVEREVDDLGDVVRHRRQIARDARGEWCGRPSSASDSRSSAERSALPARSP